ncbi:MAG: cell division topological specificity factor MinE [Chloroflexi bacterium]|nr:MAG: cell division topological specificity factor MinE [Chloroflexota bacterium]
MSGFFSWLPGQKKTNSRDVAKDRLQLVLVQDRVNLSAQQIGEMKDELIEVISRYVEIDRDGIDITLTRSGRQSRLTADIPILGARH